MGIIAWNTLPWRLLSTVMATAINLVSGKLGEVFWNLLADYQKARLTLFLDPDKDPLGGRLSPDSISHCHWCGQVAGARTPWGHPNPVEFYS
jgi:cell division protein FtsW (lipid II flippase)